MLESDAFFGPGEGDAGVELDVEGREAELGAFRAAASRDGMRHAVEIRAKRIELCASATHLEKRRRAKPSTQMRR